MKITLQEAIKRVDNGIIAVDGEAYEIDEVTLEQKELETELEACRLWDDEGKEFYLAGGIVDGHRVNISFK